MFVNEPIEIQTERYAALRLRGLTLGDLEELDGLVKLGLEPREFTVHIVHHQITEPSLGLEEVRDWPDNFLAYVAAVWAANPLALNQPLPDDSSLFTTFKETVLRYISEQNEKTRALIEEIATPRVDLDLPALKLDPSSIFKGIQTGNQIWNNIRSSMSWLDSIHQMQRQIDSIIPRVELPNLSWIDDINTHMSLPDLREYFISTTIFSNNELTPVLDNILESARSLSQATNTISQSIEQISSLFAPLPKIGELFSTLPDLTEFFRQQAELARAEKNLEESGYAFANHLWTTTFRVSFAKLTPEIRGAVATNKLLAQTRSKEFQDELRKIFEGSSVLKRRWPIVGQALEAHQQRNYIVSVPMFLTQLEGIIADVLIFKGSVFQVGKKLYAKGPDGKPKKDRNNNNIEVKGLGQLVNHSDYHNHTLLNLSVELLVNQLVSERNAILHGRRTSYGTAKLSTQVLLLLFIFAREVAAIELKRSKSYETEPIKQEQASFLQTARSLQLDGPADWSANIDDYLYGGATDRDA